MAKNTFYKIYSGDYAEEGYSEGIKDGKNSQPKNKLKVFKILHPINYVWSFNQAFNSFSENYNTGYLDGQRVKHELYRTPQYKETAMSEDHYQYHINLLEVFTQQLITLKDYLENSIKPNYGKQIAAMSAAGFVQDYIEPLQNKYQHFTHKIDQLNTTIEQHQQEIQRQKEALEQLKAIARSH